MSEDGETFVISADFARVETATFTLAQEARIAELIGQEIAAREAAADAERAERGARLAPVFKHPEEEAPEAKAEAMHIRLCEYAGNLQARGFSQEQAFELLREAVPGCSDDALQGAWDEALQDAQAEADWEAALSQREREIAEFQPREQARSDEERSRGAPACEARMREIVMEVLATLAAARAEVSRRLGEIKQDVRRRRREITRSRGAPEDGR